MQTNEQKVQTGFILSIIGYSAVDLFILGWIFCYRITINLFYNQFALFFVVPFFAAPLVLGSIALYMIKDAREVTGRYKVFYIISRVLSIVSIVIGAILCTIGFIYLAVRIGSTIIYGCVISALMC